MSEDAIRALLHRLSVIGLRLDLLDVLNEYADLLDDPEGIDPQYLIVKACLRAAPYEVDERLAQTAICAILGLPVNFED